MLIVTPTKENTKIRLVGQISLGLQVIGTLVIIGSLSFSIALSYNLFQLSGSEEINAPGIACVDGTADNACSSEQPFRCVNGILTEDSQSCGCPAGSNVWADGSCTTYAHIKTYQQYLPYCTWTNPAAVDYTPWCHDDLVWAAQHYDVTGAFTHQKDLLRQSDPGVRITTYRNPTALTNTEVATSIPAYCQGAGCVAENAYLHFTEDTQRNGRGYGLCIPGYNPSNQPPGFPASDNICQTVSTDHFSRASTVAESRVSDFWEPNWMMTNLTDAGVIGYNQSVVTTNFQAGGVRSDNLFIDIADYIPQSGPDLRVTQEYAGLPLDGTHPRIQETFDFEKNLAESLTTSTGRMVQLIVNARDSATHYYFPFLRPGYNALNANTYIEVWDAWEDNDAAPSSGGGRAHYYSLDYVNSKKILANSLDGVQTVAEAQTFVDTPVAQKFILEGLNYGTDVARSKLYLLADFYLLNNENLTFAFHNPMTEVPPGNPNSNTDRLQEHSWVSAAEFPIGQPAPVPAGQVDIFGSDASTGTTQHYLFEQGADPSTPNSVVSVSCAMDQKTYHIFARNYTNALVLVKFRDYCGRIGATSATNVTLPIHAGGTNIYQLLNADGTLSAPINNGVISLRNNEGAILIPVIPQICEESWTCSDWSPCQSGSQSRTCTDANACGTTTNRPALTQTCSTPPPPAPSPTCTPDVQCSTWSACDENLIQTRTCRDVNQCSQNQADQEYVEQQVCRPTGGSDDHVAPETVVPTFPAVMYSGTARLRLQGTDNSTSADHLRYYYQLDQEEKRVVPEGNILVLRQLKNGEHVISISAVDESANEDPTPAQVHFRAYNVLSIVTVPQGRTRTTVHALSYLGTPRGRFFAFPAMTFWGGNATTLEVQGDYTGELAVAPGRGGPPEVRVFSGSGSLLNSFYAFPKSFRGGVRLAAVDFTGDGRDEIIAVPGVGGPGRLRVFSSDGQLLAETLPFGGFRGGLEVASGYPTTGRQGSLLVSAADQGGGEVIVYSLQGNRLVVDQRFNAFPGLRNIGVSATFANVDGKDQPEIVATISSGNQPAVVKVFSLTGQQRQSFSPSDLRGFRGGYRVSSGDLFRFDNRDEILLTPVSGAHGFVSVYGFDTTLKNRILYERLQTNGNQRVQVSVGHL